MTDDAIKRDDLLGFIERNPEKCGFPRGITLDDLRWFEIPEEAKRLYIEHQKQNDE